MTQNAVFCRTRAPYWFCFLSILAMLIGIATGGGVGGKGGVQPPNDFVPSRCKKIEIL